MRYIFVDHFRGFQETLLPIKDVNFFVGENSTGKTSLLALLKLFHSVGFWLRGEFESRETEFTEIDLGNYEDIVSMHAKDKKYFHVGEFIGSEKDKDSEYDAFLMSFSESLGMPRIERYTLVTNTKKIDVEFKGRKTYLKLGEADSITEEYSSVRELFLQWVESHKEETSGFRELKASQVGGDVSSIGVINAIIQATLEGDAASIKEASLAVAYPSLYSRLIWLAPIRTKPEPIYTKYDRRFSSEGHHIPYSIKRLLESKAKAEDFKRFVEEFGKESGLFDSVDIKKYKSGRQKVVPFEIEIVLSGKPTNITNVGYGVSQVLPIVVELFTENKGTAYLIQQPEIHLHPKAQAALGDLFFNLAVMDKKKFLVETHSDFIIDRFRMNFRNEKVTKKPESQIVYFENTGEGNVLKMLDIDIAGNISKDQPKGYREFFLKEGLRALGY